ncbi:MAG TPA: hypothetical protein VMW25_03420 [Clostridia bacterium]|nr:hypothetical protein [Clostridia bacterium]
MSEEILYTRKSKAGKFEIVSIPGRRNYSFDKKKKDRLLLIRITNRHSTVTWAYSYKDQEAMSRHVAGNIIIPRVAEKEIHILRKGLETKEPNQRRIGDEFK